MEKVVFISGASSGIGFDAARELAIKGCRVYAGARRVERMEPLKAYGVTPLRLDVTDPVSREMAVNAVLQAEGRIDVLVNNAGYGSFGAIETISEEEARRQLDVNLFGLSELCRLVLPAMRERGSGRIVNVASVAGKAVIYFGGWYHVSKFAVEAFSDALRIEMKPFGVDVVIIEPGCIKTEWGAITADHLKESSRGTPYEKPASTEADLIRDFYASNWPSKPSVVTRGIVKASLCRHPRARYRMGLGSHALVTLHALLPTRLWDALFRLGGRIHI